MPLFFHSPSLLWNVLRDVNFPDNATSAWLPNVSIKETPTSCEFHLDVPGVRKEDLSVELHDGHLVIKGRRDIAASEGDKWHAERPSGPFERWFKLPFRGVAPNGITASHSDGVLTVVVVKPADQKTGQAIPIKSKL
eukprot:TRINITY_DN54077_c0_g1_i1.p1 TRINITY_DN54077_c0_g1~~TRINITY_DN54077_c0_g1_i1.p1  ORF type:complete len:144 (-),score=18.77 TRINITY_DN54077_c0_g1_i1:32-442(-)